MSRSTSSISALVHGGIMREIEPQPVGRNDAAGLFDMRAEHFAQCRVQQMRGGVISHGRVAHGVVHARPQLVADGMGACATMR